MISLFIGVLIPVLKRNILKQSNRIHKIKRTATACPGVLTIGTSVNKSHYKNYQFSFNYFGGYLNKKSFVENKPC